MTKPKTLQAVLLCIGLFACSGCDKPTRYAMPIEPPTSSGDETYRLRAKKVREMNSQIEDGTRVYQPEKDIWR